MLKILLQFWPKNVVLCPFIRPPVLYEICNKIFLKWEPPPPPYKLFKKIEVFFRGLPQSNCALHSYGAIAISAKHDIVRNDLDRHKCRLVIKILKFLYAVVHLQTCTYVLWHTLKLFKYLSTFILKKTNILYMHFTFHIVKLKLNERENTSTEMHCAPLNFIRIYIVISLSLFPH